MTCRRYICTFCLYLEQPVFAPFIIYWWFIFGRLRSSSFLFSFDTRLTTSVDPSLSPHHPNANTYYQPHSTATQPPTLTSATHCSQHQHQHPKCQPPLNTSPGLHDIENKYVVSPIADAIYSINGWLSTTPTRTQHRHPLAPPQLLMPINTLNSHQCHSNPDLVPAHWMPISMPSTSTQHPGRHHHNLAMLHGGVNQHLHCHCKVSWLVWRHTCWNLYP